MGMSEGTIVEWAVKEGAHVERNTVLVSIETEKVVSDIPAPYSGFLHISVPAGETVPIETPIAKVADTEQEYVQLVGSGKVAVKEPVIFGSDSMTKLAQESEPSATSVAGAGRIPVSGLARKIANLRGIDIETITGTGPGGRIVRRDVPDAANKNAPVPPAPTTIVAKPAGHAREKTRIPIAGMRKAIAERMVKSKTTAAPVYLFLEVDVTRLMAAREALLSREKELETRVSMTALYVKALADAVRQVPICNSTLIEDEIIIWDNVNVAIAVSLPGKGEYDSGLITPVVRDVDSRGLLAIDREIKDLVTRARAGTLTPQDMAGGTVNLSSSAGFFPGGWMVGTPLLNLPMVVSFNPGTPIQKPVIVDGQVAVRTILPCGLTFDHRALDGELAGRLARTIADRLANPALVLL
jgi:pyruvate/2-oxoglutarate dehydrogenase complex dihydrolipoamide acyltransferase (E2) component